MSSKLEQQQPKIIILAGSAGTGKSSIGEHLLDIYKDQYPLLKFVEGDDLHPRANVEKMSRGHPLNDDDRWGWLQKIAKTGYEMAINSDNKSIISCSSLKKKYRDLIRDTEAYGIFYFIFLSGSKEHILQRLYQRKGHFMKSNMLDSQFDDLELPKEEESNCFVVHMDDKNFEQINDNVKKICDQIFSC